MAHRYNSQEAAAARRARGAHAANRVVRMSGRVPGEEARAVYQRRQRLIKLLDNQPEPWECMAVDGIDSPEEDY